MRLQEGWRRADLWVPRVPWVLCNTTESGCSMYHTHYGYGMCRYGCGVRFSDLRVTHDQPYRLDLRGIVNPCQPCMILFASNRSHLDYYECSVYRLLTFKIKYPTISDRSPAIPCGQHCSSIFYWCRPIRNTKLVAINFSKHSTIYSCPFSINICPHSLDHL